MTRRSTSALVGAALLALGVAAGGAALGTVGKGEAVTASQPARWVERQIPARGRPAPNQYAATVTPLDAATRARMTGVSWRPGCPVGLDDLRLLTVRHWGFDGAVHEGVLVVHERYAGDLVWVFGRLFAARFPIERMQLVDDFGADDDRSTMANNTSAFNCRAVTGGSSWSEHSYGRAIDINPVQNPYVRRDGSVLDPKARPYVDRRTVRPGMIVAGDAVTSAFTAIGWGWGGNFRTTKDYQHFSSSGR